MASNDIILPSILPDASQPITISSFVTNNEYYAAEIVNAYVAQMNIVKRVLDTRASNPNAARELVASDYDDLAKALQQLVLLSKSGMLNRKAVANIASVLESLQSSGIKFDFTPIPPTSAFTTDTDKIGALKKWQSLAGLGVEDIVSNAVYVFGTSPTRSLQSMVELEYVRQGNEIIAQQLGAMEEALATTESILNSLQAIQNISNQITVNTKGSFKFPPDNIDQFPEMDSQAYNVMLVGLDAGMDNEEEELYLRLLTQIGNDYRDAKLKASQNGTTFEQEAVNFTSAARMFSKWIKADEDTERVERFSQFYKIFASAHFTQLFPTAVPEKSAGYLLLDLKRTLSTQLTNLEEIAGQATRTTPNSLAFFLYKVIQDISSAFRGVDLNNLGAVSAAVSQWILDNQDKRAGTEASNATGNIQANITQAISSTQNLNDTQKQEVSRYMFLFQEFYKSSSDVLQKVTQIIEKLAQGIGRG